MNTKKNYHQRLAYLEYFHINPKYWDRHTELSKHCRPSSDAASYGSDQDLLIQQFL